VRAAHARAVYSLGMRRPVAAALLAAALLSLGALSLSATPSGAATPSGGPAGTAAPGVAPPAAVAPPEFGEPAGGPPALGPPQAKAWMVVDADTGAVIAASADHTPLRPASVVKVVTALVAAEALPSFAVVPVGPDAAGEEAAKINMQAGQVWSLNDTLHSLLIVSANDAAEALADRVSGSATAFGHLEEQVLGALGAVDNPIIHDPAGLDDSFANSGGDYISAYDLAVAARAAMTVPAIRDTVSVRTYPFDGPDGVHHVLRNHNLLLGADPSSVGVKDGYTAQAGNTYIGMVSRGGRTMMAIELGITNPNMYDASEYLFTLGFATPVSAEPTADRLPPVRIPDVAAMAAADARAGGAGGGGVASPARAVLTAGAPAPVARVAGGGIPLAPVVFVIGAVLAGLVVQRRRVVVRRRRRAADRLAAGLALLAPQKPQRGVDGPEVLRRGEVIDTRERDQAGVG